MGIQNVPAVVVVDGRGGVPKDDMKLLSHEIRKERSLIDQVLAFLSKKAPEQVFNKVSKVFGKNQWPNLVFLTFKF